MTALRMLKHNAVLVLRKDGWSALDIAMVLAISRATVERLIVEHLRNEANADIKRRLLR